MVRIRPDGERPPLPRLRFARAWQARLPVRSSSLSGRHFSGRSVALLLRLVPLAGGGSMRGRLVPRRYQKRSR